MKTKKKHNTKHSVFFFFVLVCWLCWNNLCSCRACSPVNHSHFHLSPHRHLIILCVCIVSCHFSHIQSTQLQKNQISTTTNLPVFLHHSAAIPPLPQPPAMGKNRSTSDQIRCPCRYNHNVGEMIQCDKCQVWQHFTCVAIKKSHVPDNYVCERCSTESILFDCPCGGVSFVEDLNN